MQSQIGTINISKYLDAKHASHFFTVVSPFQVKGDCLAFIFDESEHWV